MYRALAGVVSMRLLHVGLEVYPSKLYTCIALHLPILGRVIPHMIHQFGQSTIDTAVYVEYICFTSKLPGGGNACRTIGFP